MQFLNRANGKVHIKRCQKSDPFGNRCTNRGSDIDVVYAGLKVELDAFQEKLMSQVNDESRTNHSSMEVVLNAKRNDLQSLIAGLERIEELYIDGKWTKAKYSDVTEKQERKIQRAREEVANIEKSLAIFNTLRTKNERLEAVSTFKKAWDAEDIDNEDLNRLARALVDRIEYIRDGDDVGLNIKFL